jgi:hypothetical protein
MPANNELQWTVGIIAQVQDELSDFEYNEFEKTIKKRSDDVNLNYIIFYFNQGTQKSQIKILNKYKEDFDTVDITEEHEKYKKNNHVLSTDMNASNKKYILNALYDKDILIDFLKNNIAGKSDRYMLITWGHGSGLGFFVHEDNDKGPYKGGNSTGTKSENAGLINLMNKLEKKGKISNIQKSKFGKLNRKNVQINNSIVNASVPKEDFTSYRFDGVDDSDIREIQKILDNLYTADDLAKILDDGFKATDTFEKTIDGSEKIKKTKIDLFIANSCWMNTFEAGCTFMDRVKVYAAPQAIVPFAGIDYDRLFAALEDNPDLDRKALAEVITDNYAQKYTSKNSFTKEFKLKRKYVNIRELTISVNDLTAFEGDKKNKQVEKQHEGVINCVNKLGNHLAEKLQSDAKKGKDNYRRKIDIARSFCGDFTHAGNYIDFTNFFSELIKTFQDEDPRELKDIYYDFYWAKEQTLLSIYSSERLFSFMPEYFYSQSPQMFSIYFPPRTGITEREKEFIKKYYNATFEDKCSGWMNFLEAYVGVKRK